MQEKEKGNLLVVVIDLYPSMKLVKKGEGMLIQCLEAVISFCSTHLLMNSLNKLAVIGCHTQNSDFLYPAPSQTASEEDDDACSILGQHRQITDLNQTIRQQIKDLVLNRADQCIYTETLLASALTRALCYINRVNKDAEAASRLQKSSRILVITSSGDDVSQYLNFMNTFFTAQKLSTALDVCVLENDCGLLKQGSDITGGIYIKIQNIEALLQYLLWIFVAANGPTRSSLVLPPSAHAAYKTVCFCHRTPIDIGYVCSVCLSIFCTFSPICSTCHSTFKFKNVLKNKKKKSGTSSKQEESPGKANGTTSFSSLW